jgi:hypothetical protein
MEKYTVRYPALILVQKQTMIPNGTMENNTLIKVYKELPQVSGKSQLLPRLSSAGHLYPFTFLQIISVRSFNQIDIQVQFI